MNLYSIGFSHHAPKSSKEGVICLVLADNDEQVYEFIKSADKINGTWVYHSWESDERFCEEDEKWWDDEMSFKEYAIKNRGTVNDDNYDYSDAYYGITLYGWTLIKENVTGDYSELIETGFLIDLKTPAKEAV